MSSLLLKLALADFYSFLRVVKYKSLSTSTNTLGRCKFVQPVILNGKGLIKFGDSVVIGVKDSPLYYSTYSYIEARHKDSRIEFGDNVWSNNNLTIVTSNSSVYIGSNVNIGWNVSMIGSDFHGIDISKRRSSNGLSGSIEVGENAWICSNATILKGVRVGCNSIIGAGSIVLDDIPSNVVAAGIPAKIIRRLD